MVVPALLYTIADGLADIGISKVTKPRVHFPAAGPTPNAGSFTGNEPGTRGPAVVRLKKKGLTTPVGGGWLPAHPCTSAVAKMLPGPGLENWFDGVTLVVKANTWTEFPLPKSAVSPMAYDFFGAGKAVVPAPATEPLVTRGALVGEVADGLLLLQATANSPIATAAAILPTVHRLLPGLPGGSPAGPVTWRRIVTPLSRRRWDRFNLAQIT
jgi:hypothetical protein